MSTCHHVFTILTKADPERGVYLVATLSLTKENGSVDLEILDSRIVHNGEDVADALSLATKAGEFVDLRALT